MKINSENSTRLSGLELESRLRVPVGLAAAAILLTGLCTVNSMKPEIEHVDTATTTEFAPSPITLMPLVPEILASPPVQMTKAVPIKSNHHVNTPNTPKVVTRKQPSPKPTPAKPRLIPKHLSYNALRRTATSQIDSLPSLTEAAKLFPNAMAFQNIPEQLAYIGDLEKADSVSVEDYRNFSVNKDYIHAFDNQASYNNPRIETKMLVQHWTGKHYPGGVQQFIKEVNSARLRVLYFMDRDTNVVYQLFDDPNRFPQHAKGTNQFSQGIETEATGMLDLTPAEHKTLVLLNVYDSQLRQRLVNRQNIVGHYAVDLLYYNPTYDGKTGTFHASQGRKSYIDKFDFPQEYINVLVEQSRKLQQSVSETKN